jgi:hypothetical protein
VDTYRDLDKYCEECIIDTTDAKIGDSNVVVASVTIILSTLAAKTKNKPLINLVVSF